MSAQLFPNTALCSTGSIHRSDMFGEWWVAAHQQLKMCCLSGKPVHYLFYIKWKNNNMGMLNFLLILNLFFGHWIIQKKKKKRRISPQMHPKHFPLNIQSVLHSQIQITFIFTSIERGRTRRRRLLFDCLSSSKTMCALPIFLLPTHTGWGNE